jgi:hypothetical protein
MDEQEMMVYLSIVPDEVICTFALQEAVLLEESFAANDRPAMIADLHLSQMIHAELIWRGLDVEALDFFSKINAVHPVLRDIAYSDYVEVVREAKG